MSEFLALTGCEHDASGYEHDGGWQAGPGADEPVVIDCDSCAVRMLACGDCVVSVLLGAVPGELEAEERRALDVLADSGLVPPLRLVPMPTVGQPAGPDTDTAIGPGTDAAIGRGTEAPATGSAGRPARAHQRSRRGGGYTPPAAASTG